MWQVGAGNRGLDIGAAVVDSAGPLDLSTRRVRRRIAIEDVELERAGRAGTNFNEVEPLVAVVQRGRYVDRSCVVRRVLCDHLTSEMEGQFQRVLVDDDVDRAEINARQFRWIEGRRSI